jgi:hypothetical protein
MIVAIANSQRKGRSKELFLSLPDGSQGIGWPFFLAYRQAGVTFFCHKKKLQKKKCRAEENFDLKK